LVAHFLAQVAPVALDLKQGLVEATMLLADPLLTLQMARLELEWSVVLEVMLLAAP